MTQQKQIVRFRASYSGFAYVGKAQVEITKGSGITDETGYTDEDEAFAELLEVWNEDVGTVIKPTKLFAAENAPFRRAMEVAAFDEFYNPTSSEKLFPGEEMQNGIAAGFLKHRPNLLLIVQGQTQNTVWFHGLNDVWPKRDFVKVSIQPVLLKWGQTISESELLNLFRQK